MIDEIGPLELRAKAFTDQAEILKMERENQRLLLVVRENGGRSGSFFKLSEAVVIRSLQAIGA